MDVTNLRSETYASGSRIPDIVIGTPLEDALRRDLTINALFYNINQDMVEDFTGTGLDDLAQHVLRTPLNPAQTFADDPLRVLRTARFAARFPAFTVHAEIEAAGALPEIATMLETKVSRERFGLELTKLFKSVCDCVPFFAFLVRMNLYPVLFRLPAAEQVHPDPADQAYLPAAMPAPPLAAADLALAVTSSLAATLNSQAAKH